MALKFYKQKHNLKLLKPYVYLINKTYKLNTIPL